MAWQYKLSRVLSLSAVAFAAGLIWAPDVSVAGDGFGMAMGVLGGVMRNGGPGGFGPGYRHRGGGGGGGGDSPSERQDGKQEQVKNNENAALFWETVELYRKNLKSEKNRNVDLAIGHFIQVLEAEHKALRNNPNANVRASTGSNINQITEGEIRVAVEKAYQDARLSEFDTLAGELWTSDRLTVQILREAESGIRPYFRGVGARGPDVTNLQEVFKESASSVYARALEVAEIIGVSKSFDHFIRTIYENSDQAPVGLQTVGADVQYERMLTRVINDVDHQYFIADRIDNKKAATLAIRLSHQFDFRFRARRALYDCLAASYVGLISDGPGGPVQQANDPKGSRGAQIGIFGRAEPKSAPAAANKPQVVNVVESGDTSEAVWKRARQLVGDKCREITIPYGQAAAENGLKPISSRTNLAVAAGLATDRSEGQYMQIRTDAPR